MYYYIFYYYGYIESTYKLIIQSASGVFSDGAGESYSPPRKKRKSMETTKRRKRRVRKRSINNSGKNRYNFRKSTKGYVYRSLMHILS